MSKTFINILTHKDGNKLGRRKKELRLQYVMRKIFL